MKKMLLILTVVFVFVGSVLAVIPPTISQAITTSGYVAVRLPADYSCEAYFVWTEDESDFYMASESDGSDGVLVPGGKFGTSTRIFGSAAGTILFYAKGTSSTNLVGAFNKF